MPSFDIVSKINMHEVKNAVDQANREVSTRFDFKDSNAMFEISDDKILMTAPSEFHLKQMRDILDTKLSKREVDIRSLDYKDPSSSLRESKQEVIIKQGLDAEMAKNIVKIIKSSKLKVQASIQGDQVRVSGKKRDDLQDAIATIREQKLNIPLQFENFRD